MRLTAILFSLTALCLVGFGQVSGSLGKNQAEIIDAQADNLDPNVLKLGLKAYAKARAEGYDSKGLLTIIDYSKVSSERRLWVIDLNTNKVLFNTWVSHGKNSGVTKADSFSNEPRSLKSSLGVFVTDDVPYSGHNGYSLRLKGLESGFNDKAFSRDIVIHGAWYVNPDVVKRYGQLGRSWGCPAVSPALAKPLIDTIKKETVVFVYYPNQQWLKSSSFLTG